MRKRRPASKMRIANAITRFSGSMRFVYAHAAVYGLWIVENLGGIPGLPALGSDIRGLGHDRLGRSDLPLLPSSSSRRTGCMASADRRAELDVQISLLAEAEITKLVELVSEIAARMDVPAAQLEEIDEMKRQVAPEAVLDAIEESTAK